jgi:hypothetical protein
MPAADHDDHHDDRTDDNDHDHDRPGRTSTVTGRRYNATAVDQCRTGADCRADRLDERERLVPSRREHEAVIAALADAEPAEPTKHDLDDIVALATCLCGATFDGNGSTRHALAQLDAHIQENTGHV